jgi:hypothetical protein
MLGETERNVASTTGSNKSHGRLHSLSHISVLSTVTFISPTPTPLLSVSLFTYSNHGPSLLSPWWSMPSLNLQSTSSREMRQRNEQFSGKARAGKNPVNASRKEKLAKQSPIPLWALGLILFVVIGGGTPTCSLSVCITAHSPWSFTVFFEAIRLFFL